MQTVQQILNSFIDDLINMLNWLTWSAKILSLMNLENMWHPQPTCQGIVQQIETMLPRASGMGMAGEGSTPFWDFGFLPILGTAI